MLYSTLDFNNFRRLSMFTIEEEYGAGYIFSKKKLNLQNNVKWYCNIFSNFCGLLGMYKQIFQSKTTFIVSLSPSGISLTLNFSKRTLQIQDSTSILVFDVFKNRHLNIFFKKNCTTILCIRKLRNIKSVFQIYCQINFLSQLIKIWLSMINSNQFKLFNFNC